jgi:hypothetical protein
MVMKNRRSIISKPFNEHKKSFQLQPSPSFEVAVSIIQHCLTILSSSLSYKDLNINAANALVSILWFIRFEIRINNEHYDSLMPREILSEESTVLVNEEVHFNGSLLKILVNVLSVDMTNDCSSKSINPTANEQENVGLLLSWSDAIQKLPFLAKSALIRALLLICDEKTLLYEDNNCDQANCFRGIPILFGSMHSKVISDCHHKLHEYQVFALHTVDMWIHRTCSIMQLGLLNQWQLASLSHTTKCGLGMPSNIHEAIILPQLREISSSLLLIWRYHIKQVRLYDFEAYSMIHLVTVLISHTIHGYR